MLIFLFEVCVNDRHMTDIDKLQNISSLVVYFPESLIYRAFIWHAFVHVAVKVPSDDIVFIIGDSVLNVLKVFPELTLLLLRATSLRRIG